MGTPKTHCIEIADQKRGCSYLGKDTLGIGDDRGEEAGLGEDRQIDSKVTDASGDAGGSLEIEGRVGCRILISVGTWNSTAAVLVGSEAPGGQLLFPRHSSRRTFGRSGTYILGGGDDSEGNVVDGEVRVGLGVDEGHGAG